MEKSNSYIYFALQGDDFDPEIVTNMLGTKPTVSWRKGDKGIYNPRTKYSCWELSTEKGKESIFLDNIVTEIVDLLYDKIEIINKLKRDLDLTSVLGIVMDIDTNQEQSTPTLGHDLRTIEFIYKTKTTTDVDIYRYDSTETNKTN
ncbi:MAG: DUF4279 domain-containing protein [Flavobacteriaceae bacterium]|nr:DUF4279 domain-containing protein [Flavobacteriaceae bacterium]